MECTIYLSEECNLRCSYCYEGDKKRKKIMSSEALRKSLDFIMANNQGEEDINLTFLGGEPLMNKKKIYEFIDLVEKEYSEASNNFRYAITTNGVLLDEKLIELFKNHSFDVSISIDGDKQTHNLNRVSVDGKDVYGKIIANMEQLQESGLYFSVRMTATQNNIHILSANVRHFYDMGIKNIHIGVDTVGHWSEEALSELDYQYDQLDNLYLNRVSESKDLILNLYDFKLSIFVAARTPKYCSGGTAGHIVINSQGELFPCGYVVNDSEWNLGQVKSGLDESKFVNSIKKNVSGKSKCHECDIAFTCTGAKCGFYNYFKTGKLNVHSQMTCKLERLLYKHNLYVLKEMYRRKSARLFYYLEKAEEKNIPLSETMLQVIIEEKQEEIR